MKKVALKGGSSYDRKGEKKEKKKGLKIGMVWYYGKCF